MPRIAFRLWLKDDPQGIETYVHYHLNPFDGLYDLIRAAGIERYTIWLDGTDLFLTREGDDPTKGETLDMNNPVHAEWAATMTPLFQERVRTEGAGRPQQVWAFDPDGTPGPVEGQMTYLAGLEKGQEAQDAVAAAFARSAVNLAEAMQTAGVMRAWTFIEDGAFWTLMETQNLEAAEESLAADPACQVLWADLAPVLDDRTRAQGWRRTREVFRCD